ncbi:MAG: hypothetical protein R3C01_17025 [Planctomycetaceae bacterium]
MRKHHQTATWFATALYVLALMLSAVVPHSHHACTAAACCTDAALGDNHTHHHAATLTSDERSSSAEHRHLHVSSSRSPHHHAPHQHGDSTDSAPLDCPGPIPFDSDCSLCQYQAQPAATAIVVNPPLFLERVTPLVVPSAVVGHQVDWTHYSTRGPPADA